MLKYLGAAIMFLTLASAPAMAEYVSIGFEGSEGYSLGSVEGQNGWNGGTPARGFFDYSEAVVAANPHSGNNSWHVTSGYDSPGPDTPFSPKLSGTVGYGLDSDTFSASLWIMSDASTSEQRNDGSYMTIYMGSPAGDDRTHMNLRITNTDEGIELMTKRWGAGSSYEEVITTMAYEEWHQIEIDSLFAADPVNDVITYTIDGGTAGEIVSTGNASLNPWRAANGYGYTGGSSLKFTYGPQYIETTGYYLDDITYGFSPEEGGEAIPEPATLGLFGLGAVALGFYRRKRK
jgi:PEP-CTERM motif